MASPLGTTADRYLNGAQQPFIDESACLRRRVQKAQLRQQEDPDAAIHVRALTSGGFEEHDSFNLRFNDYDQPLALLRYPLNATEGAIESKALISDIWNQFDGAARSRADEIDYRELNLLLPVDSANQIIAGGTGKLGHMVISWPGEQASVAGLDSVFPVAADEGVPANCSVESSGATDSTYGKSGLAQSFCAYIDHTHDLLRVHRGLNSKVMHIRVEGAR